MNKVLIGIGVFFVGAFFTVAALRAAPMSDWGTPFHTQGETVTYEDRMDSGSYGPGGCHGGHMGFDEEYYSHHHDYWQDDSDVPAEHLYYYMHMSEEEQDAFDLEYAVRVNALDIESFESEEALQDELDTIRTEILDELWDEDADADTNE